MLQTTVDTSCVLVVTAQVLSIVLVFHCTNTVTKHTVRSVID